MPKTAIPINFFGGHYEGRSKEVNSQRSINLYPVLDREGGKVISLEPTPGLKEWSKSTIPHPVRALLRHNEYLFAVIGNRVLRYLDDATYETCTGTLGTYSGQCFMAANANDEIMVLDVVGEKGYYVSGLTLTEITDSDFITANCLAYQDGYGIVTEKNTGQFWLSALNDFSSWSALDYGSAETLPDDVLAVISDHRELWMFGHETAEPYQNTGNVDFPFERIGSAVQEIGIGAGAAIAKLDNTIFFPDQWGNIRRLQGYIPIIVSTPQIGYQISTYPDISDAVAFGYVHEGHSFYVITFPQGNNGKGVTWCYDAATNLWHQRSSYPHAPNGRWRANCYAFFGNKHLVGDYGTGVIYELDHEYYTDNGEILPAVRRAQHVELNGRAMFLHEFELHIQGGAGLIEGQGSDPQVMLTVSKDGGNTWGNEKWRSMGAFGEYYKRVRWLQLGKTRSWTPEILITDPVNRTILDAYLYGELGIL